MLNESKGLCIHTMIPIHLAFKCIGRKLKEYIYQYLYTWWQSIDIFSNRIMYFIVRKNTVFYGYKITHKVKNSWV